MGVRVRDRGVALVLVSGLLVVVSLLSVFFLRMAVLAGAASRGEALRRATGLAAESGMDYAAARLLNDSMRPGLADRPETACDDWACRDLLAVPSPAVSPNPSYRRGGHYSDLDGNGIYLPIADAPAPVGSDPDGNGTFDAWSGRLRGAGDPFASRFSLMVDSLGGRVCVNSGELGAPLADHDADGILNRDDAYDAATNPAGWREDSDGNGVPDWRDPAFSGNLHLVNILNNLGAVLGLSSIIIPSPSYAPGTPALGDVEVSDLGEQVVRHRPRGGYPSIAEMKAFLPPEDHALVAPFLSTEGEIVPVAFPSKNPDGTRQYHTHLLPEPEAFIEWHARIDFQAAPVEVLQAALRYISASGTYGTYRVGMSNYVASHTPFVRLGKDEADRIAVALDTARQGPEPIASWKDLLQRLRDLDAVSPLFEDDPFTVYDDRSDRRRCLKEDLILAQFDANGYFLDPYAWRKNSLDVDREPVREGTDRTTVRRIMKGFLAGPLNSAPYNAAGQVPPQQPIGSIVKNIPARLTMEFSLSQGRPVAFDVRSQGWVSGAGPRPEVSSGLEGTLPMGGAILLTGQQDFERIPRTLADLSAADDIWRSPGGEVYTQTGPAPTRNGIQTLPGFPRSSSLTGGANFPVDSLVSAEPLAEAQIRKTYVPLKTCGALALSATQWGDAQLQALSNACALPFNEDGPVSFGVNTYTDLNHWDNFTDPMVRPPEITPSDRVLGTDTCLQGFLAGPAGLRNAAPKYNFLVVAPQRLSRKSMHEMGFTWEGSVGGVYRKFPITRIPWLDPDTGIPWPPGNESGNLDHGTIVFSYPCRGADSPLDEDHQAAGPLPGYLEGEIAVRTRPSTWDAWQDYLRIMLPPEDDRGIVAAWATLGAVASGHEVRDTKTSRADDPPNSPWRQVALVFEQTAAQAGTNDTTMSVYLDGLPADVNHQQRVGIYGSSQLSQFMIAAGPIDDVMLLNRALTPAEVLQLAQKNARHSANGTCASPHYRFSADDLPSGADLAGLTWDAFIPHGTGGRFSIRVIGRDEAGAEIGRHEATWDTEDQRNKVFQSAGFRIPGARRVSVEIDIAAVDGGSVGAPEDAWPEIPAGSGVRVLQDTPILDEVRVFYNSRRPSWRGYASR